MDSPVLRPTKMPDEAPFYIPSPGSPDRPRFKLKHNDTFAIVDAHGDIGAAAGDPDGIFNTDTRFLSRLELLVDGHPTLLLSSQVREDNCLFAADLTNTDIYRNGQRVLNRDTVHIRRASFVWNETFHTRIGIRNYGASPLEADLDVMFASDFADIFETRGLTRGRRGTARPARLREDSVSVCYRGLDDVEYCTTLHFEPKPRVLEAGRASFRFRLDPGQRISLFISARCHREGPVLRPPHFLSCLRETSRFHRGTERTAISVETSSEHFDAMIARSLADLRMLMTETPEGAYPYAGIPWYSTTFGRDGIITALELLWCMPQVARGVLARLAAFQATTVDPVNDAEPGKILHEMRGGEMARLREVPFGRYYGSVDATPLFVLLAGAYAERTGDYDTIARLWPHIEAALTWIETHSALDGDGFLRHSRSSGDGLANQGWKDSFDSIFHADGRLAEGSIALAEVQAYVFAAQQVMARVAARLGRAELAGRLKRLAGALAARFERAFWCEELGTYGIALDGEGVLCRVSTSNAGHVLFAGMASVERAHRVADGLMAQRFFSGWGIRTVAEGESRYNPMSYHNGSIWPHDNALIAMGLGRYGLKLAAARLLETMSAAASALELSRLPELFCGFRRFRGEAPTLYPVACSPQAWASAAPLAMLQACLAISVDPDQRLIRLVEPTLPSFLDRVTVRNLPLGEARIDFALHRRNGSLALQILRNEAGVDIFHDRPV